MSYECIKSVSCAIFELAFSRNIIRSLLIHSQYIVFNVSRINKSYDSAVHEICLGIRIELKYALNNSVYLEDTGKYCLKYAEFND